MVNKLKQIGTYLLVALISNIAYGVVLYFLFIWLNKYSLLHAYIGNLLLIISALAIDEYYQKFIQSDKFIMRIKGKKDSEKIYHSIQQGLNRVGSFKSDIYLFYIFILIFSQIIDFFPSLAGENFSNFIRTNDYSILVLVAFDTLIGQFYKDRERMKKATEKIKKSLIEHQD